MVRFHWLALLCLIPQTLPADPAVITATVDPSATRKISPWIYGVNSPGFGPDFPDWDRTGVPFTVARMGGNRLSAYNWKNNASNAGADWHHQNDDFMGRSGEPGRTVRNFLEGSQRHGAATILTVQTIGHVAADKNPPGDVNLTPGYLEKRFVPSRARRPVGTTPDPNDRSVYQDEQVKWIESIKVPSLPVWYMLDNEPDIWAETHARIVTNKPGYADIISNNVEYGSAVKDVSPGTLVFGPANYGWNGFRSFQNAPDANGRDFLEVYLDGMKRAGESRGGRILDVLDIHWYPEARGGGRRVIEDDPGNKALEEARIQSPRSLWDPSYVEESWITRSLGGKPVALIPLLLSRIDSHYPGTALSFSEYNFGGGKTADGMIAQADALGIFGRYGLFAACNWGISLKDPAMLAGFRAYLDFDGKGGRFGSLGLGVTGTDPAQSCVYAALDTPAGGRMTVVAINKTKETRKLRLRTGPFTARSASAHLFVKGSFDHSLPQECSISAGEVETLLPPRSVTSLEILGSISNTKGSPQGVVAPSGQ